MAITNGYCTLAEVKAALRLTDNDDDTLLERAIEGASRRIDGYCNRWFYKTSSTAVKLYSRNSYVLMTQDIANTTVTLKTDDDGNGSFETTWTQGVDYQLEPTTVVLSGFPYHRIVAIGSKTFPLEILEPLPAQIEVTAQWGWNAIPHDVREACILLAMRQFARLNAALGVVGFADMAVQVRAVDPDVRDMLAPYRLFTAG
jgi:hypothetical protein